MILTADYHTHTPYSHGKNTVLENAVAAQKANLKQIAITDHGFNHLLFGLKRRALPDLRSEIEEAEKLTVVKVLMGMESNLISVSGETDMRESDLQFFDIYLCGIHEVLKYKSLSDMSNIMLKN
ncbi:MAG: PHP domain-containing protein, partial [Candidatus Coproplasma sp.]